MLRLPPRTTRPYTLLPYTTLFRSLNSIAVDAAYRSRGIGKALARWGMDSADAEGKDIWLISAPAGRAMYLSLGFKELAEGSRAGEGQYLMRFGRAHV